MDAKICTFCALDVAVGALLWTILSNKLILQPLQLPKLGHKNENPKIYESPLYVVIVIRPIKGCSHTVWCEFDANKHL